MGIQLGASRLRARWTKSLGFGLCCTLGFASSAPGAIASSTDHVPDRLIVSARPGVPVEQAVHALESAGVTPRGAIPQIGVHSVQLRPGSDLDAVAAALRALPEVARVEREALLPEAEIAPNDPFYPYQSMDAQIALPQAWSLTTGHAGVTIAILDGGVDGSHPDLVPNLVPGWNFYDNSPDTGDIDGHGTKSAGTAGALGNNLIGVAGVAWSAKIMPIRTSNPAGQGEAFAIAQGLVWAADHGARVANLGYDVGDTVGSSISSAAQYFKSRGGVVTAAAGNEGSVASWPNDPNLLIVSAITQFNGPTSWSNTGSHVDLCAPQASFTTIAGGGYGQALGTSYSAAFAAGVGALALSVNPALTGQQLHDLLLQTSDDMGAAGWDPSFGWGRLNALRAVQTAVGSGGGSQGGDTQPPTVEVTSPKDQAVVKTNLAVKAGATDNVGVVKVEFYLDGAPLGVDTSRPYSCTWAAKSAAKGAHTLQCKAYDAAGNVGTSPTITVYR